MTIHVRLSPLSPSLLGVGSGNGRTREERQTEDAGCRPTAAFLGYDGPTKPGQTPSFGFACTTPQGIQGQKKEGRGSGTDDKARRTEIGRGRARERRPVRFQVPAGTLQGIICFATLEGTFNAGECSNNGGGNVAGLQLSPPVRSEGRGPCTRLPLYFRGAVVTCRSAHSCRCMPITQDLVELVDKEGSSTRRDHHCVI